MKRLIALALVTAPLALADKQQVQPGEWEVSMQMEMEGSPVKLPPMKQKRCVTPAEAAQPHRLFKPNNQRSNDCEMKNIKQEGNKLSWTIDCKTRGHGSGSVTFQSGQYDGATEMTMVDGRGVTRHVRSTISGRRIGECSSH